MRCCVLKDPLTEMREPKATESGKTWISLGSCLFKTGSILPIWADFLLFPSFASALPPMVPMSSSTQAFIMLAILESFPFLPSNPYFAYLLRPPKSAFLLIYTSLSMLLSWFLSASSMYVKRIMYVKKGFQGLRWWSSGHLPVQGMWVWPLVRELRSHMLWGNWVCAPQRLSPHSGAHATIKEIPVSCSEDSEFQTKTWCSQKKGFFFFFFFCYWQKGPSLHI